MVVEVNSSSGGYRWISWRHRVTTHLQSLASHWPVPKMGLMSAMRSVCDAKSLAAAAGPRLFRDLIFSYHCNTLADC